MTPVPGHSTRFAGRPDGQAPKYESVDDSTRIIQWAGITAAATVGGYFIGRDYPLMDAASEAEWHYFIKELLQEGDLELAPQGTHPPNTYRLTFTAWGKLDPPDQVRGREGDQSRPLRVFLCHASEDKASVRDIYERLKTDGFSPWLDEEDLLPGQEWEEEIPKAVKNADAVIVFVSRRSVPKEGYFQKEIKFALDVADEKPEGTIFLIPARLEEWPVPERLSRWHWVDLFHNNGYEKLKTALETRAANHLRAMSAEARNRISEAQRKRWAAQKKAGKKAAKKSS